MRQRLSRALESVAGVCPVPIFNVADRAGWVVEYAVGMADAGALGIAVVMPDVVLAVIDKDLSSYRRRYVLAHEMGHLMAGHTGVLAMCTAVPEDTTVLDQWAQRREEHAADLFAARILIPDEALKGNPTYIGVAEKWRVPTWLVSLRMRDIQGSLVYGSISRGWYCTD